MLRIILLTVTTEMSGCQNLEYYLSVIRSSVGIQANYFDGTILVIDSFVAHEMVFGTE